MELHSCMVSRDPGGHADPCIMHPGAPVVAAMCDSMAGALLTAKALGTPTIRNACLDQACLPKGRRMLCYKPRMSCGMKVILPPQHHASVFKLSGLNTSRMNTPFIFCSSPPRKDCRQKSSRLDSSLSTPFYTRLLLPPQATLH